MWTNLPAALALAAAAAAGPAPATSAPSLETLLQRPQYERVEISPDGTLLAIAHRRGDGTVVSVLNRADRKAVAEIDPGNRGEVSALAWVGSQKLLIAANRSNDRYGTPIVAPKLYLLNIHEKHPRILPASFIGTIDGDDSHILVYSYDGLQRLDIDRMNHSGETIATAPEGAGNFVVDHAGTVRFASGWDDKARGRTYVRTADAKWKLLNDSDVSHVNVTPLGISRDNRTAFLQTERRDGPDVIESYDLASGARKQLLGDATSDPLGTIWSVDQHEPIGAWFGPGRPQARYWNPTGADAKWRRALTAAFPDSNVAVTSATTDGSALVIFTYSDRDDGSFYLLDLATHKMELLFHIRPWLDPARLAPTMSFTMHARDGLPLHGFVTMPVGGTHPAPMVVIVHGGPYYERDGWSFDEETQLLATHGYAVLHVNFRGSGGFGLPFVERGYRQWGAAMQDDITDATHWAIDNGFADPGRICIYGGSYGGYAALMGAAREPSLYRCAIGLSGVYDLNRFYTWGDIHRSDYGMNYLKRVLGRNKIELAARSPSTLASAITIPVLLAHGALDGRVPLKHAREMRRAMKKAGHPVEYVEYEWEGHGLAKPEDELDFYTRMLSFLDANLSPPSDATTTSVPP